MTEIDFSGYLKSRIAIVKKLHKNESNHAVNFRQEVAIVLDQNRCSSHLSHTKAVRITICAQLPKQIYHKHISQGSNCYIWFRDSHESTVNRSGPMHMQSDLKRQIFRFSHMLYGRGSISHRGLYDTVKQGLPI